MNKRSLVFFGIALKRQQPTCSRKTLDRQAIHNFSEVIFLLSSLSKSVTVLLNVFTPKQTNKQINLVLPQCHRTKKGQKQMCIKLNEKNLYSLLTQYFHNSLLSSTQSALWRFGLTYTPPKWKDILTARLKMLYNTGTNTSHLPKLNVSYAEPLWKSNVLNR